MTPMQKLKPQFDKLKELLGSSFKEINLNKADYKEAYTSFCGETTQHINKGVKSDFIRLYRLQLNTENTTNLAFSFNYLDTKEEKENVRFSMSLGKIEKKFSKNVEMSVEECREHLNKINSILNVLENASYDEIIEVIKEDFLGKDYNFKTEIKKKKIR